MTAGSRTVARGAERNTGVEAERGLAGSVAAAKASPAKAWLTRWKVASGSKAMVLAEAGWAAGTEPATEPGLLDPVPLLPMENPNEAASKAALPAKDSFSNWDIDAEALWPLNRKSNCGRGVAAGGAEAEAAVAGLDPAPGAAAKGKEKGAAGTGWFRGGAIGDCAAELEVSMNSPASSPCSGNSGARPADGNANGAVLAAFLVPRGSPSSSLTEGEP